MIENVLHNAGADVLALIGGVDNHIPDRGSVDEVGEDAAETDETGAIPRRDCHVRMAQHFSGIVGGACLGPRRLPEEGDKLGRLDVFAVGEGDHGLESSALLVLGYCLRMS